MYKKFWKKGMLGDLDIAILVPCYNEARSIGTVVREFSLALPQARIYVFDNNSEDDTISIAQQAGAIVRHETHQGKGNVIRRMFSDIDAEIYVLIDGDGTYSPSSAPSMILKLVNEQLDMVCGRRTTETKSAYRRGHRLGNRLLTAMVALIFGNRFNDMLSGYRIFSRRFVKSFPALTTGFEIETELTVHALELRMPTAEVPTPYQDRPTGSISKLRTYRDGFRILTTIIILIKEERPLQLFVTIFAILSVISIMIAIPVLRIFIETGLVPRLPTAVLATGLVVVGFLSLVCGLILDTVTRGRREAKRMRYLQIPAPGAVPAKSSDILKTERMSLSTHSRGDGDEV